MKHSVMSSGSELPIEQEALVPLNRVLMNDGNGENEERLISSRSHEQQRQHVSRERPSKRGRKHKYSSGNMTYELIFALLLLCSSSLQITVLALDHAMASSHSDSAAVNSIQRKRGGARVESSKQQQQQNQRIAHHRKLAATSSNNNNNKRALQQPDVTATMCTCSPLILNVRITLTSTDPCINNDLLPNAGIDNTICLYTNPLEGQLLPPVPPAPVVTTMQPTNEPTTTTMTTEPPVPVTPNPTEDPFRPPIDPPSPSAGGGSVPTYTPTSTTYSPTEPTTPFPTFVPTEGEDDSRKQQQQQPRNGQQQQDSSNTEAPTEAWPTFSPTTNPTYDDTVMQPRGGWLPEDERSMDDDELIGPHHHRHHHHHHYNAVEDDRRLEVSEKRKGVHVIHVDKFIRNHDNDGGDDASGGIEDGSSNNNSSNDNNKNGKEVKPSYYQPPISSPLDTWVSVHPNDAFFNEHPDLKAHQEEIYRMRHGLSTLSSSSVSSPSNRNLQQQEQGVVPTRLVSAQFLEMDTSPDMQIINQDDQYINITFVRSDPTNILLQFSSISNLLDPTVPLADQMQYVPGGGILLLVGATDEGEVVRNRLMWTYTMGCGLEDYTILDGDVIGWAGFENLTPAREEFCPASGNLPPPATNSPSVAPTPSPTVAVTKPPSPTTEPTKAMDMPSTMKPTKKHKPSKKPSMSMGSGDIFDHFDLSGKSKKKKKDKSKDSEKSKDKSKESESSKDKSKESEKSKTKNKNKRRGSDERDLDKMREDFRTLRRRETVMEFGRPQ